MILWALVSPGNKDPSAHSNDFLISQMPKRTPFAPAPFYGTFNPFTELMQRVHRAGLAQLNLGLGTLQGSRGAEGLSQGQHYLIHLREGT